MSNPQDRNMYNNNYNNYNYNNYNQYSPNQLYPSNNVSGISSSIAPLNTLENRIEVENGTLSNSRKIWKQNETKYLLDIISIYYPQIKNAKTKNSKGQIWDEIVIFKC